MALLSILMTGSMGLAKNVEGTMYKSPFCMCCENYIKILAKNGIELDVVNHYDIATQKEKFSVPDEISSCHTIDLNGYVVEGHVPIEVVQNILKNKPNLYGVSVPGMPANSPGMGEKKDGEVITVYVFEKDGRFKKYGDF